MTGCILSGIMCARPDEDGVAHLADAGSQACFLGAQRLAGTLRAVVELVDELAGGGYVERDGFDPVVLFPPGHDRAGELVPHRDPVANVLTSGPINGRSGAPRVAGSGERSLPIRVDPTDLLARARPASLAVAVTGLYASDQIGHLAVATELEFWARDWADTLGHHVPPPTVPLLAEWLLLRLDWACAHHGALDEFAGKLRELRSALTAQAGRAPAPDALLAAPCPNCGEELLYRDLDLESIACGACPVLLSEEKYAEHVKRLIEERP